MPTQNSKVPKKPNGNPIPQRLWTRGLHDHHPRPLAAELKAADGPIDRISALTPKSTKTVWGDPSLFDLIPRFIQFGISRTD